MLVVGVAVAVDALDLVADDTANFQFAVGMGL
jgi:hypothetical protein